MTHTSTYELKFKRRREQKTNYRKRLQMLKSGKPRLTIRKSNNNTTVQLVEFKSIGDRVLASAHTKELAGFGWKMHTGNVPSAYLAGMLCALKAKKLGLNEAVADIGLNTPVHGSRVFAAIKGAADAGLKVGASAEAFPSEQRICGKHIEDYASKLGEDAKKRFSACIARGAEVKKFTQSFEQTKKAIMQKFGEAK